jgi:maltooligosyltrehalose trehalohydrolase
MSRAGDLRDGDERSASDERLGATVVDGGTRFVVWAPHAERSVEVVLDGDRVTLEPLPAADPGEQGYVAATVGGLGHGDRYAISIDGADALPDPASAWQPDGVHAPSAIVDTSRFEWSDDGWRGHGLDHSVVYEMHVGAFTPDGTFDAAVDHLDRLAALGVTTLEVMPVAAFPGSRNWGYDGVLPYAVHDAYGGPEAMARFVDAAHARGLAVILDVVYNHLGPEGNYLARFGPYFTDAWSTPWGAAVNVADHGSDGVRRYFIEHATRWLREFHLDGYRFDAVHAIPDPTARPFWEQVNRACREVAAAERRRIVLIAETADNDPRHLHPAERNGFGFDAVWCDDVHHTLRVAATGERRGYYADYAGTATELADVLAHRWKFRGQYSVARGRRHGRPIDEMAPNRFVACSQNHDQVGNRPAGERPDHHVTAERRRWLAATVLLAPTTPMLFMGEEYGERRPFPFFVDHTDPQLLRATNEGRRAEFVHADWSGEVPRPGAPATFRSAVLDPAVIERDERSAQLQAMYAELLRLRREHPAVADPRAQQRVDHVGEVVRIERRLDDIAVTVAIAVGDAGGELETMGELVFAGDAAAWGGAGATRLDGGRLELAPWTVALVRLA